MGYDNGIRVCCGDALDKLVRAARQIQGLTIVSLCLPLGVEADESDGHIRILRQLHRLRQKVVGVDDLCTAEADTRVAARL